MRKIGLIFAVAVIVAIVITGVPVRAEDGRIIMEIIDLGGDRGRVYSQEQALDLLPDNRWNWSSDSWWGNDMVMRVAILPGENMEYWIPYSSGIPQYERVDRNKTSYFDIYIYLYNKTPKDVDVYMGIITNHVPDNLMLYAGTTLLQLKPESSPIMYEHCLYDAWKRTGERGNYTMVHMSHEEIFENWAVPILDFPDCYGQLIPTFSNIRLPVWGYQEGSYPLGGFGLLSKGWIYIGRFSLNYDYNQDGRDQFRLFNIYPSTFVMGITKAGSYDVIGMVMTKQLL